MKYAVIVTPEAEENIATAFDYIAARAPLNAARWLRALYKQIDGLEQFPQRFGQAREQPYVSDDIRQVIFKSHRIVFTINEAARIVHVVYVRHGGMRPAGETDDTEAPDNID